MKQEVCELLVLTNGRAQRARVLEPPPRHEVRLLHDWHSHRFDMIQPGSNDC